MLCLLVLLVGCQFPRDPLQDLWNKLLGRIGGIEGTKRSEPSEKGSEQSVPLIQEGAALASRAHAEILQEMLKVVFLEEVQDRSTFGSLVDSLNQGGTLEGIYNGLVHSTRYASLERDSKGASATALERFTTEMAWLVREFESPTTFDLLADPVRAIATSAVAPTLRQEDPLLLKWHDPDPENVASLKKFYGEAFVGRSLYLLKRILGDEALKVVETRKGNAVGLATWYSHWVAHIQSYGVDLGLAARKNPDREFHYQWALKAGYDRVIWEILNRLHRVLNEAKSL